MSVRVMMVKGNFDSELLYTLIRILSALQGIYNDSQLDNVISDVILIDSDTDDDVYDDHVLQRASDDNYVVLSYSNLSK
jgi:hypothetical protein